MFDLKHGTMIAIAAGALFAAACKKADEKKMEAPAAPAMKDTMEGTKGTAEEMQPAAAMKPTGEGEKAAKIHCQGVNECKGKGGCKSAANACAGQNGCKGHGFVEMTEEDCKAKGGTVTASM